jgi:hypothetical protein
MPVVVLTVPGFVLAIFAASAFASAPDSTAGAFGAAGDGGLVWAVAIALVPNTEATTTAEIVNLHVMRIS